MRKSTKKEVGSLMGMSLEEVLRHGARAMLQEMAVAEVEDFIIYHKQLKDDTGHQRVVRNGYHNPREIIWGGGKVEVEVPRARDRKKEIVYTSKLIPRYLRRAKSFSEFIPYLYLKGISTGDFSDVLSELLGEEASLSAGTVVRLKEKWMKEYESWNKRDLSQKRYVYWWADGVYFNVRLENDRCCLLVIIGALADGTKELIAVHAGYRESELSWREIMVNLKAQGLNAGPKLAIGDGALGFWTALRKEYPETREQSCWVHITANVLDKLPKAVQKNAKKMIYDIYLAPTKEEAEKAFKAFVDLYKVKYSKAVACLIKSKEETMAFYDFPAEHWIHIRSTNPVESVFATVKLRTKKTKGCGSTAATLMMVFKLAESAQKRWQKLFGYKLIPLILEGREFVDGVLQEAA